CRRHLHAQARTRQSIRRRRSVHPAGRHRPDAGWELRPVPRHRLEPGRDAGADEVAGTELDRNSDRGEPRSVTRPRPRVLLRPGLEVATFRATSATIACTLTTDDLKDMSSAWQR